MAAEFYDPNSFAYIANINMALHHGMLHRGLLRPQAWQQQVQIHNFYCDGFFPIGAFLAHLGVREDVLRALQKSGDAGRFRVKFSLVS